ncbi:MAG TPA: hypothetical protein EYQ31_15350, partial [Candidatus Handelsmanbacteria bacterium]|nr:hypothetical protein [Candidatus Handelsmanbacteria bacterium]
MPPAWRHDLPGALVRGETVDLHSTVHVDPFDPNGGPPQVTANLSSIGGPDHVTLSPVGDGDYLLETRLDVAAVVGPHEIIVRLKQEVADVARFFDFT